MREWWKTNGGRGDDVMKLTPKQRAFADYYIEFGNAEKAAVKAGYSEKYARGNAHKLVANSGIKSYIEERMAEKDAERIAKQDEILSYLTSIMRGEQTEQVLRGIGEGAQTIDDIDVSAKDRVKAAELLLRRFPMNKQDELKERLMEAQIKKVEAEAERLTAGDTEENFEIIIKRKGDET